MKTRIFLIIVALSISVLYYLMGRQPAKSEIPQEFSKCQKDSDCQIYQDPNCCMPWFVPINGNSMKEYENWSSKERAKYVATECSCPWDRFNDRQDFQACVDLLGKSLSCIEGRCRMKTIDEACLKGKK